MQVVNRRAMLVAGLAGTATALALGLTSLPGTGTANPAAQARIGAPAPAFALTDSNGKTVSLADYKGKTVVLEWTNHDCPYVRKHYSGNNMQTLQKKWTGQGVVWLTVISSQPGSQGYVTGEQANKLTADRHAAPSAVLFDPKGDVGRAYGATVTPHMYVVTAAGTLAYMGGIDDKATTRPEDLKTAKNFVDQALGEVTQGKPVSVTTSRAYGCTIKYSS
jgi:peroxiredoxin